MSDQSDGKIWFTPTELSARWRGKPSVGTLKNWRTAKKGPKFSRIGGRVLYHIDRIEQYEREKESGESNV